MEFQSHENLVQSREMKRMIAALALAIAPLKGQIYADIEVSHGDDDLGTIRILLEHEKVPRIVANFIGLATGERAWINPTTGVVTRGTPYYDGLIFHRLIHDFVIQGGDPLGNGSGGPGFVIQDQYDPSLRHSGRYQVSCAKTSSPNTTGSQFFITLEAATLLDDKHSIFGTVIDDATFPNSRAIIDGFTSTTDFPVDGSTPTQPITMRKVTISGPDLADFDIAEPSHRLPYVIEHQNTPGIRTIVGTDGEEDLLFDMTYDRKTTFNYITYNSSDLNSWSTFGFNLSLDDEVDFSESRNQGDLSRGFFRQAAVDYTQLPRPSEDMILAGSVITLSTPTGSLILTSDGMGGGTWQDPSAGGGTLSLLEFTDSAPSSGSFVSGTSQAHFIPLMGIRARFENPEEGGITLIQGTLSFHTDSNGGFEGNVFRTNSRASRNWPFLFIQNL